MPKETSGQANDATVNEEATLCIRLSLAADVSPIRQAHLCQQMSGGVAQVKHMLLGASR